jgi:CRISPR-associated protein Csd1
MILHALNSYYERLASAPYSDIAPAGFSRQKIAFIVVLNIDGTLHDIEDGRHQQNGKLLPRSVLVFGPGKPSGSGLNPCFLWDNPAYMLGYKPNDDKPDRTQKSFEAFRQKHVSLEATIDDLHFSAVCRFLESWNPASAIDQQVLVEIGTGFGIFQIRGETQYVHDREAQKKWWLQTQAETAATGASAVGRCLVTGNTATIARVHETKIKGVVGAQSSGAALVSFNVGAAESYGKEQSFNAPVSEQTAFQYCTALNQLLVDRQRRRLLGDMTVVFWTDQPCQGEGFLAELFAGASAEDVNEVSRVSAVLASVSQGKFSSEIGQPDTQVYVMGMSPNAARISIRFWNVSRLDEFVWKIAEHYRDLEIARSDHDRELIFPWQILRETARESKDISPLLGGGLMRAILLGQPYPQTLLMAVIRRIRADREVLHTRAAVIKACLNRQSRFGIQPLTKEIDVSLDEDRPEVGYQLGRLFAELEKTQYDALGDINSNIKDKYFGAASATPGSVFPRLIRLTQHHLNKLEVAAKVYRERRVEQICAKIANFPTQLGLQGQGLFALGYYHQRMDIFTKKSAPSTNPEQLALSPTNKE